jgi:hypothetical protein
MLKFAVGALIAILGILSLGINFNPCNDPVIYNHVLFCRSNEMVIDYAANGGSRHGYDYTFSVYHIQHGMPAVKVGEAHGPGLPNDQRYVITVAVEGPNGRYYDDPWPDDAQFYLAINSSGPNNRTEPQLCENAQDPKADYGISLD